MSMYALIHGRNPLASVLLGVLDLTTADVGRFRDAFLENGDAGLVVAVYTRNGGGNRENCWEEDKPDSADCTCPACITNHVLPRHPLFLSVIDDDFDSTYCTIRFRVPEEAQALLAPFVEEGGHFNPDARWAEALRVVQQGKRKDVENALRPVFEALLKQ